LKNENATATTEHQQGQPGHRAKKPNQEILVDLLAPFHLENFAGQIEKDLHANVTAAADGKEKKHSLRVYLSTIQPAVFLTNWKHVASSSTAVL
jgi:hypothetical protein